MLSRITPILITLGLATAAAPALADWVSGGGEVIKDAQNPWFLQNTTDANVCVIWQTDNFHPVDSDATGLVNRVKESLNFWKEELNRSFVVGRVVQVGQQNFHVNEVSLINQATPEPSLSCMTADLKIQFGWLSQEQINFFNSHMGGVQNYLAATIRTDYDQVHMKGRGFIYLKPDAGPLSSSTPKIHPTPWSLGQGYLIDYALRHELGHVFGIPHKGAQTIMAVDFLERIMDERTAELSASWLDTTGFFAWNRADGSEARAGCHFAQRRGWRDFIGTPAGDLCATLRFKSGNIEVLTGTSLEEADLHPRGEIVLDPVQPTYMWEEAVRIYLPDEQTVITRIPDGAGAAPWIMGPMIKNEEFAGTFKSIDGRLERQVFLTLSPSGLGFAASRFSVEMGGRWHWNLDWEY